MLFSGLFFLYAFLPAVLIAFFTVRKTALRRLVLVIFSLVFYAWGEPLYVFLMFFTVLFSYLGARALGCERFSGYRKTVLAFSVSVNILLLAVFKYTDFIICTVNSLLGTAFPQAGIPLPIGISFFIFQSVSYIIDVYRETSAPQRSFVKLLLYISFFPQLIAGPIVRYEDVREQLDTVNPSPSDVLGGVFRFATGLAKKVLIANSCAAVSGSLLTIAGAPSLLSHWMSAVFFTLQIYFDFSGYSDMAIGLGGIFGFHFPENFVYPFASRSATEFWRRWHISLGSWFKDYLFYPFLRSRPATAISKRLKQSGRKKTSRAVPTVLGLLLVWTLTGLWHGAYWNYVLWGLYYFVFLTLEFFFEDIIKSRLPKGVFAVFSRIYFIIITVFGMAIFRNETGLWKNLGYLFGIGTEAFTDIFTNSILSENIFLFAAAIIFSVPTVPALVSHFEKKLGAPPRAVKVTIISVLSLVLIALSTARLVGNSYNPFLYFRF